jgi:hypothetical protein
MQDFGTPLKTGGTDYSWVLEKIERTCYTDKTVDVRLFDSLTDLIGDIEYPYTTKRYAIAMRERISGFRSGERTRYYYIDRRGMYLRLPTWNCDTEITAYGAYLMDSSIAANWQNLQLLIQSDTLVCADASAAPLLSEED